MSIAYLIVLLNTTEIAGGESPLHLVLLGAVIQNTDTHFLPVGGRELLDGAAVELRTEPCFRVQSNVVFILLLQKITPEIVFPG